MRYAESLNYLNSFLNLEKVLLRADNYVRNLDRMRFLLGLFGDPEKSFSAVIIAGTKGKGSTGFFLQSVLNASGIPAGFYSSPHLSSPLERIRIAGQTISRGEWTQGLREIRSVLAARKVPETLGHVTFFEVMTLLAALQFRKKKMKVGVFEAGLGGRFDATRAIGARLVILTPVELDHEQVLGNTIAKIAAEKAAVIRRGGWVVAAPQRHPEALRVIRRQCRLRGARLFPSGEIRGFKVGLAGDFQKMNAGAALQAAGCLRKLYGFEVTPDGLERGLAAGDWPGRLERFSGPPPVLLDGAHNPASAEVLARNLKKILPRQKKRILVFSSSRDKRSDRMLAILGRTFSDVVLTLIPTPRAQDMARLLAEARGHFRRIYPVASPREALAFARRIAGRKAWVVVTGSFYLLGAVRNLLSPASSHEPS
ncbi:MAG: cyanophycin synthetase [Candidatus Omnitrophota bacterium]|jgi:dihydrofolate synthase/folylpolyglutamate synthase